MSVVLSFKETLISPSGAKLETFEPLVAVLDRQKDDPQLFVGNDYPANSNPNTQSLTSFRKPKPHGSILTNRSNKLSDEASKIETTYYQNYVATAGSIINCDQSSNTTTNSSNLPKSIVWRILDNSSLIEIQPVDLNYSKHTRYRAINIIAPNPIQENCITASFDSKLLKVVIDFITHDWAYYTIAIPLSEFIQSTSSQFSMSEAGNTLTPENSSNWYRLETNPPFDLKQPHLLYAISSHIIIASLKDGSLMKIYRDSPLGLPQWEVFPDSNQPLSLSNFLWGQSDKFPMHPDLSIRTAISIASVGDLLLTVSINRKLRIWQTSSMKLLFEDLLIDPSMPVVESSRESKTRAKALIGPSPMNIISILPQQQSNNTLLSSSKITNLYFATYLPLGDGSIQIWSASLDTSMYEVPTISVSNLGAEYNIVPDILDTSSTWLVNSLHLASGEKKPEDNSNNPSFLLTIMWKSNTSSVVYKAELPKTSGTNDILWHSAIIHEDSDKEYINASNSPAVTRSDRYVKWLFGPEGYSHATIEAALKIYSNHYALTRISNGSFFFGEDGEEEDEQDDLDSNSTLLRRKVCQTVGSAVSLVYNQHDSSFDYQKYRTNLSQEWERFDRLCSELERLGYEALSMVWDPSIESFWIVKASFTSVLRPAMPIELCYYNRTSNPYPKLTQSITQAIKSSSSSLSSDISLEVTEDTVSRTLQIIDAIYTFRRTLSHAHYGGFINAFEEDYTRRPQFSTNERILYIISNLIDEDSSRDTRGSLFLSLAKATNGLSDGIYGILNFLHQLMTKSNPIYNSKKTKEGQDSLGGTTSSTNRISTSGAIVLTATLHELLRTCKLFVADAIITLLATYSRPKNIDTHIQNYSKYLLLFKALQATSEFLTILPTYQGNRKFDSKLLLLSNEEDEDVEMGEGGNKQHRRRQSSSSLSSSSTINLSSRLSFFQQLILTKRSRSLNSVNITSQTLSKLVAHLWGSWNLSVHGTSASRTVAELLQANNDIAAQEFSVYLPNDSFSSFILAHVNLRNGEGSKSIDRFRAASVELSTRELTHEEAAVVSMLPNNSYNSKTSFGKGMARYFNDAAKTVDQWGYYSIRALQLAKLARVNLANLIEEEDEEEEEEKEEDNQKAKTGPSLEEEYKEIHSNLFDIAIKSTSLDDAYSALIELDMVNNYEGSGHIDEKTGLGVDTDAQIMPYVERLASLAVETGQGGRLAQYPFIGLTRVVTRFFVNKAKQSLFGVAQSAAKLAAEVTGLSGELLMKINDNTNKNHILSFYSEAIQKDSLIYYNALYSWSIEHQDLRGGKLKFFFFFFWNE